jgi:capsular polysaccharide biosynthesis protein
MNIRDYLHILRKRILILIGIPLIAVVAVALVVMVVKPRQYTATATVAAPALVGGVSTNQYSGANGPKAFVANFISAATSDVIVDKVAAQTHVPKNTIKAGLAPAEVGQSSLVTVTYTTKKKKEAGPVAQADASQTIVFLFNTQLQLAEQPVTQAQNELNLDNAAIANFRKTTGQSLPDETLQNIQQEIANLQETQAVQRAEGNATTANGLSATISSLQAQATTLQPQVATYLNLENELTQAQTNLQAAQTTLQQTKAQYEAANPSKVVILGTTTPIKRSTTLIQDEPIALGASLFLALGVIALLEAFKRSDGDPEDAVFDTSGHVVGNGSMPDPTAKTERVDA